MHEPLLRTDRHSKPSLALAAASAATAAEGAAVAALGHLRRDPGAGFGARQDNRSRAWRGIQPGRVVTWSTFRGSRLIGRGRKSR
jgi:hypothetical protein